MKVAYPENIGEFNAVVGPLLERDPVKNQLILGNIARLGSSATRAEVFLAVVESGEGPLLAAMHLAPYRLLLASVSSEAESVAAAAALGQCIDAPAFPGVLGEPAFVEAFCQAYGAKPAISFRHARGMHIHELKRVIPPPPVAGKLRRAQEEDLPLVTAWAEAFGAYTQTPGWTAEYVRKGIEAGNAHLWDDDRPKCMAFQLRALRAGISIGGVYTPPQYRRRGIASACVAALSQQLLDQGYSYCSLFTEAENAISNHIYHEIGYRRIASVAEMNRVE